jgi:hypothetical protein
MKIMISKEIAAQGTNSFWFNKAEGADMKAPRSMQEAFGTRGEKLHVEDEPIDPNKVMMLLGIVSGIAMLLCFIFEAVK